MGEQSATQATPFLLKSNPMRRTAGPPLLLQFVIVGVPPEPFELHSGAVVFSELSL